MNPVDLFIIYLACGAPFGVYYFLNNRTRTDAGLIELKTLLVFIFWMPFALLILRRETNFKIPFLNSETTRPADAEREKDISTIQKELEKILAESSLEISIYEFRETIERFVGLTLAARIDETKIAVREREVFRISLTNNVELGSICLNRRNRKRLSVHQSQARKDFLYLIGQLLGASFGESELASSSIKFVRLLKETEAESSLKKIFADWRQTEKLRSVADSEKDLWKPEKHKLSPSRPISPQLQTINRTMNLREKD